MDSAKPNERLHDESIFGAGACPALQETLEILTGKPRTDFAYNRKVQFAFCSARHDRRARSNKTQPTALISTTMSHDYKSIFHSALDIANDDERARFLNDACGGDASLRAQVESLLQAHAEADHFMQPGPNVEAPRVGPEIGQVVGGYKLREKLGEGGMGIVYIAEQTKPVRRKVALKIIKPGMDTREVVARFEAERQALALMDHPNIAKIFDGGSTEHERPYFVMELVRGIPITDYCDQACLTTSERLSLFVTASRAVQHAHQRGIIHRDIKPSNILISLHDGNPVVKIIDFGVAKAINQQLSEMSVYTRFQQILGTPLYMSPEQAELSGLDIDTRSDVYSLGVVLYELLTGVTPFDRQQFSKAAYDEMRRIIREEEPKKASTRISTLTHEEQSRIAQRRGSSPLKLAQQLRGELDWILTKTLEKDRNRRYESSSALALDIDRYLKNEPVEAGPPNAAYRLRKLLQRNQAAALTTLAIAASLVLGTVVATLGMLRAVDESNKKDKANEELAMQIVAAQNALQVAQREKKRAVRTAYLADMRAAFHAIELNNLALARQILDRYRDFDAQEDPRHWEWRALWLQCQGNAERTIRSSRGIPLLSISPDEKWAAAGGGGVRVWDLTTEKLAHVLLKQGEGCQAKFSPHGHRLYVGDGAGSMRSWSVPDFEALGRPMMHGSPLVDIEVSADNEWLVALGEDGVVSVWDPQTREMKHRKLVGSASSLAITGDKLAIGLKDSILILDLGTLDEPDEIIDEAAIEHGRALEFSPDGQFIAHSTVEPGFMIYRVSDGANMGHMEGHTLSVRDLAYSPDGKLIASASSDQTIRLWDADTHQQIAQLRGHERDVWCLAYSNDGQRLYSGGGDGQLAVWNISEVGQARWPVIKQHACGGGYLDKSWFCYSPDGKRVATTKHRDDKPNAGFFLRSSKNLEVVQTLSESGPPKTGVRYSPVDNLLVVGDMDGSMDFITFDDVGRMGSVDRVVVKEGRKVFPIRFTADGQRLLVTARTDVSDIFCAVYSVRDRKPVASWLIPRAKSKWAQVSPATISPDGQLVATGQEDGIRLWSVNDPVEPRHLPMPAIYALEFSPDGNFLIAGSRPMAIVDVDTMRVVDHLVGHMQHVSAIRFSRDGRRVASAGSGKIDALRIWDFESRREIMTFMVDGFDNRQIEWSPDGTSILMMGGESNLSMWRVPSYEDIRERERRQTPKTDGPME